MTDLRLVSRWMKIVWADSLPALAMICVLSVANAILVVTFPWLWQYLIDALNQPRHDTDIQTLLRWMIAVGVGQTALYLILQGTRSIINARISWRARRRVFEHLSVLPPAFYRQWRAGDLVTRLSDDAGNKISWFLCSGIFRTVEAALTIIACLAVMVSLAPALTLQIILPLPLLILGQAAAQNTLSRRYRRVQQSISTINDTLTATFSGIRVIQASRLQAPTRRRFRDAAHEQRDAEISVAIVQQIVFLMYGYGWQLAIVALLLAGGNAVLNQTITLGQFVSFEGFLMTLVWPMFDVGMFVSKIKQASVALSRLQAIIDTPAPTPPDQAPGDQTALDIVVHHATVTAPDGATLLDDVTLSVPEGSTVAVVGRIGAGKTSLIDLLAGQRPLSEGALSIGGLSMTTPWPGHTRRQIGHVPQDTVMLSATVEENLLLGREATPATIDDALRISRLAQDLPDLPDGLQTPVGERGVTLSGGQQQRLAIARALVGRPRILLLDDATAALDADTEAAFWEGLARALPNITVVMATHRIATIQRADQIIVLSGGQIAQRGSHEELLAEGGEYLRIYGQLQANNALKT